MNKFKLLIKSMTVALTDYDKRSNHEKSFKDLTVKFDKKSLSFRDNSKFKDKHCDHCDRKSHVKQTCFYLNLKLRSDD